MFYDVASLGPAAWPNIIVCCVGLGWLLYWTRGKWTRIAGGLKGAALGSAIAFIVLAMLDCSCGDDLPVIPGLLTIGFSAAYFGSTLPIKPKKIIGWLLTAAFVTFAMATATRM